jgi:hypothetical protein
MDFSPELGAAVIGLLVAVTGWIKNHSDVVSINHDREAVKVNRDADSQKLHDDVLRLQCTQNTHADNIKVLFEQSVAANASIGSLTTQVAQVITRLDQVIDSLKELKQEFRNGTAE